MWVKNSERLPRSEQSKPRSQKAGFAKILYQGGNKLLDKKWPKGDITQNKRDRKGQTDNG